LQKAKKGWTRRKAAKRRGTVARKCGQRCRQPRTSSARLAVVEKLTVIAGAGAISGAAVITFGRTHSGRNL